LASLFADEVLPKKSLLLSGWKRRNHTIANEMDKLMTKKTLRTLFLAIVFAGICATESGNAQAVTTWGETICGTQLSVGLSNNIALVGSTITLTERIRNQSVNVVWLNPTTSETYVLANLAGKKYRLMPTDDGNPVKLFINNSEPKPEAINAEEIKEWSVKLMVGKDIEPGDYELKSVRSIITESNQVHTLTSNSLDMKVAR
jgi:hypothetical protein